MPQEQNRVQRIGCCSSSASLMISVLVVLQCPSLTTSKELAWLTAETFFNAGWDNCNNYGDPNISLRALQTAARLQFDGRESPSDVDPWKRKLFDSAAEIALRGWAHNVGLGLREDASLVLPKVGGGEMEFSWRLGEDLRDVAEKGCCFGYRSSQGCFDVDESFGETCVERLHNLLLDREEDIRPPASAAGRAPRYIPDDLFDQYTDDGEVDVHYMYKDDAVTGSYVPFGPLSLATMQRMAREQKGGVSYADVDQLLYKMLNSTAEGSLAAAIAGSTVGVIGSTIPWYESLLLAYGAAQTYTIEYNEVFYTHPNMTTVTTAAYEAMGAARPRFPVVFSISSIEHDGLGRYGDPLNPDGDFGALRNLEEIVAPGGLLVLAVPVGEDRLVWNCHRIYGKRRLTRLLRRWTVVQTAGLSQGLLAGRVVSAPQPVLLLRNARPQRPAQFADEDDPVWGRGIDP